MFNIVFKGDYVSDEEMIRDKTVPDGAVEYGIVSGLDKEMGRGFLMEMPLLVLMIAAIYFKVKDIDYHLKMDIHLVLAFFLVILSVYILTIVHEVIHALFYPAEYEKQIWRSKEQGAYFVYCEEQVSRSRFIVMCLAPMFLLGILPFLLWLVLPVSVPMPYYLAAAIVFWLMTIVAIGDAANVYHVLKEVLRGAAVFNRGMLRSYYIKK